MKPAATRGRPLRGLRILAPQNFVLTPKLVVDREYTPAQRRVIDARLAKAEADIKAGRVSKAFSNHGEFIADPQNAAAKLGARKDRDPSLSPATNCGDALLCSPEGHPKRVIPAQAGIHRLWAPAFTGATRVGIFIPLGGPEARRYSLESHVIRAQAGIQLAEVDPRLRGGDEGSAFISMGGPQAHDRSE